MEYSFTEEELSIKDTIARFAKNEIAPLISDIEKEGFMPEDLVAKINGLKISGLPFLEELGGAGGTFTSFFLAIEELAYAYLPCTFYPLVNAMTSYGLASFGSDYLKEKYLRGLLNGKLTGAWAFTEPDTGSDPKQLVTKAVKSNDKWVINGIKRFITNSKTADFAVIFALTDNGVTAFVVETDAPGYRAGKREKFLAMESADNGDIILENVTVGRENILGEIGKGFDILLFVEAFAKVSSCAGNVGLARSALGHAVKYAKEKTHRGTPIGTKFQMTQFNLASMGSKVAASRALMYSVAAKMDKGEDVGAVSSFLKIFSSITAREVATDAVQVHGAYGLSKEYDVERLYREARFNEVILGSNEIQRVIAANALLRGYSIA